MGICRLCLAKDANFSIVSPSAALRILACTSIEIDPADGMPQHICPACRLRIEEFHHFRRRCQAADRRLRRRRKGPNPGGEDEEEEELPEELQDVAGCSASACSESNAQWRLEAAQLIRSEINAYKKDLLGMCKQTVRAEIEEEVRRELTDVLLLQAKQQVRLDVLDDVFAELEHFFVRKRGETAFEMNGSESYCSEYEDIAQLGDGVYKTEAYEEVMEPTEVGVIESSGLAEKSPQTSAQEALIPVPMVEINMDQHLSHLREEFHRDVFLDNQKPQTPATQPPQSHRPDEGVKRVRFELPKSPRQRDRLCRQHSSKARRHSQSPAKSGNCVRCRLRGADKHNRTVS
ncbi:hypothetical protein KR018_006291 [Drosophila ironensis]|nr:hypothetical protein KR018_006291 [Drosophila ironensis]